ncbi:Transmembrane protein [Paragonimus heterotremus]|uniref:BOS complex subunit TMEM147 n=1 Tax=Paragonimus heterotremus TaxID=100268 RepID=A0A8J4WF75_9TREM|nr:Transmembrane protein [Paragonimus heterotremus]
MGLFHLANCLVLATGPYFIVYRATGMKENDAFWRCCKIMIFYGLTQMLKFFLATLAPHDYDFNSQNNFLFLELPGAVIELLVIFFIIRRLSARNEFGVLVASMGWSLAALFATSYIPIWVGAKGIEFEWRYLCLSFQANLEMITVFSLFHTVWLLLRKKGPVIGVVVGLLNTVALLLRQTIFGLIEQHLTSMPGEMVLKTLFALSAGLATLVLRTMMRTDRPDRIFTFSSVWTDVRTLAERIGKRCLNHTESVSRIRELKTNGHVGPKRR